MPKKISMWGKIKTKLRPLKTLAQYRKIAREKEDEHGRILAENLATLKEHLLQLKFQELSIVGEIKKVGEEWGLAHDLPKGRQLHVRAVRDPEETGQYVLGAHVEAHRKRPGAHLQGDSDHKLGGKMLQKILNKTRMFRNLRVKMPGKWFKVKVSLDKLLKNDEMKIFYAVRARAERSKDRN